MSLSVRSVSEFPRRVHAPSQVARLEALPPTRIVADAADPDQLLTVSDLRQLARALAEGFEHKPARALWEPSGWYREQVNAAWGPVCSPAEAQELRKMTVEICRDVDMLRGYLKRQGSRGSEGLNAVSFVALVVFLFALLAKLLPASWGGQGPRRRWWWWWGGDRTGPRCPGGVGAG